MACWIMQSNFQIPAVTIFLNAMQRGDGACEISIRDASAGIAGAEQEKNFLPFARELKANTRRFPALAWV